LPANYFKFKVEVKGNIEAERVKKAGKRINILG
jgi:hypothetical protein